MAKAQPKGALLAQGFCRPEGQDGVPILFTDADWTGNFNLTSAMVMGQHPLPHLRAAGWSGVGTAQAIGHTQVYYLYLCFRPPPPH